MLNQMSTKDPAAYQGFVDEQIRSYRDAEKNENDNTDGTIRHFRPEPGFVFKCQTTGGDGIKIRESPSSGKTLYVILFLASAFSLPLLSVFLPLR